MINMGGGIGIDPNMAHQAVMVTAKLYAEIIEAKDQTIHQQQKLLEMTGKQVQTVSVQAEKYHGALKRLWAMVNGAPPEPIPENVRALLAEALKNDG